MIIKDEKLLRQKSEPVSFEEGLEIGKKLIEEVQKVGGFTKAFGLSAPQIGIFKRVFITWGSTGERGTQAWIVHINPEIKEYCSDERMFYTEGCLSFPGISVRTNRNSDIVVEFTNESNEQEIVNLIDIDAIVFQHELDHLDGRLMFDRIAKSVPQQANTGYNKIGRNDPCPCGSGKKYKKCCGK